MSASPTVAERMRKVEALTRSPNPGEAAAARERLVAMEAKYGRIAPRATDDAGGRTAYHAKPGAADGRWHRRYESPEAFEAWSSVAKKKLERMLAERAAERFNDAGLLTVRARGGWLHAGTGMQRLSDAELAARARERGFL